MIAFETKGSVDDRGFLRVEQPIGLRNRKVRVLVLLQEEEEEDDWLKAVSTSPSLDFLRDESEDIYTIDDGFEFQNEK